MTDNPTKTQEIESLRAFQQSCPIGSYLREMLAAIVPDMESAIRGDLGFIDFRGHIASINEDRLKLQEIRKEIAAERETQRTQRTDGTRFKSALQTMREDADFISRRLAAYRD